MSEHDAVPDPSRAAALRAGAAHRPDADPFLGLTDDARVAEAVAARAGQRDLTARAMELATMAGTLRDLAEARAGVGITTTSGRTVQGAALGVATDHVVLATGAGQHVLVALAAVAVVRPDPADRAPIAQGERAPAQDLLLLERCAVLAEERPEVAVGVRGSAELLRGQLAAVADDVLTITGVDRTPAYVAAAAVEVVAIDRGLA